MSGQSSFGIFGPAAAGQEAERRMMRDIGIADSGAQQVNRITQNRRAQEAAFNQAQNRADQFAQGERNQRAIEERGQREVAQKAANAEAIERQRRTAQTDDLVSTVRDFPGLGENLVREMTDQDITAERMRNADINQSEDPELTEFLRREDQDIKGGTAGARSRIDKLAAEGKSRRTAEAKIADGAIKARQAQAAGTLADQKVESKRIDGIHAKTVRDIAEYNAETSKRYTAKEVTKTMIGTQKRRFDEEAASGLQTQKGREGEFWQHYGRTKDGASEGFDAWPKRGEVDKFQESARVLEEQAKKDAKERKALDIKNHNFRRPIPTPGRSEFEEAIRPEPQAAAPQPAPEVAQATLDRSSAATAVTTDQLYRQAVYFAPEPKLPTNPELEKEFAAPADLNVPPPWHDPVNLRGKPWMLADPLADGVETAADVTNEVYQRNGMSAELSKAAAGMVLDSNPAYDEYRLVTGSRHLASLVNSDPETYNKGLDVLLKDKVLHTSRLADGWDVAMLPGGSIMVTVPGGVKLTTGKTRYERSTVQVGQESSGVSTPAILPSFERVADDPINIELGQQDGQYVFNVGDDLYDTVALPLMQATEYLPQLMMDITQQAVRISEIRGAFEQLSPSDSAGLRTFIDVLRNTEGVRMDEIAPDWPSLAQYRVVDVKKAIHADTNDRHAKALNEYRKSGYMSDQLANLQRQFYELTGDEEYYRESGTRAYDFRHTDDTGGGPLLAGHTAFNPKWWGFTMASISSTMNKLSQDERDVEDSFDRMGVVLNKLGTVFPAMELYDMGASLIAGRKIDVVNDDADIFGLAGLIARQGKTGDFTELSEQDQSALMFAMVLDGVVEIPAMIGMLARAPGKIKTAAGIAKATGLNKLGRAVVTGKDLAALGIDGLRTLYLTGKLAPGAAADMIRSLRRASSVADDLVPSTAPIKRGIRSGSMSNRVKGRLSAADELSDFRGIPTEPELPPVPRSADDFQTTGTEATLRAADDFQSAKTGEFDVPFQRFQGDEAATQASLTPGRSSRPPEVGDVKLASEAGRGWGIIEQLKRSFYWENVEATTARHAKQAAQDAAAAGEVTHKAQQDLLQELQLHRAEQGEQQLGAIRSTGKTRPSRGISELDLDVTTSPLSVSQELGIATSGMKGRLARAADDETRSLLDKFRSDRLDAPRGEVPGGDAIQRSLDDAAAEAEDLRRTLGETETQPGAAQRERGGPSAGQTREIDEFNLRDRVQGVARAEGRSIADAAETRPGVAARERGGPSAGQTREIDEFNLRDRVQGLARGEGRAIADAAETQPGVAARDRSGPSAGQTREIDEFNLQDRIQGEARAEGARIADDVEGPLGSKKAAQPAGTDSGELVIDDPSLKLHDDRRVALRDVDDEGIKALNEGRAEVLYREDGVPDYKFVRKLDDDRLLYQTEEGGSMFGKTGENIQRQMDAKKAAAVPAEDLSQAIQKQVAAGEDITGDFYGTGVRSEEADIGSAVASTLTDATPGASTNAALQATEVAVRKVFKGSMLKLMEDMPGGRTARPKGVPRGELGAAHIGAIARTAAIVLGAGTALSTAEENSTLLDKLSLMMSGGVVGGFGSSMVMAAGRAFRSLRSTIDISESINQIRAIPSKLGIHDVSKITKLDWSATERAARTVSLTTGLDQVAPTLYREVIAPNARAMSLHTQHLRGALEGIVKRVTQGAPGKVRRGVNKLTGKGPTISAWDDFENGYRGLGPVTHRAEHALIDEIVKSSTGQLTQQGTLMDDISGAIARGLTDKYLRKTGVMKKATELAKTVPDAPIDGMRLTIPFLPNGPGIGGGRAFGDRLLGEATTFNRRVRTMALVEGMVVNPPNAGRAAWDRNITKLMYSGFLAADPSAPFKNMFQTITNDLRDGGLSHYVAAVGDIVKDMVGLKTGRFAARNLPGRGAVSAAGRSFPENAATGSIQEFFDPGGNINTSPAVRAANDVFVAALQDTESMNRALSYYVGLRVAQDKGLKGRKLSDAAINWVEWQHGTTNRMTRPLYYNDWRTRLAMGPLRTFSNRQRANYMDWLRTAGSSQEKATRAKAWAMMMIPMYIGLKKVGINPSFLWDSFPLVGPQTLDFIKDKAASGQTGSVGHTLAGLANPELLSDRYMSPIGEIAMVLLNPDFRGVSAGLTSITPLSRAVSKVMDMRNGYDGELTQGEREQVALSAFNDWWDKLRTNGDEAMLQQLRDARFENAEQVLEELKKPELWRRMAGISTVQVRNRASLQHQIRAERLAGEGKKATGPFPDTRGSDKISDAVGNLGADQQRRLEPAFRRFMDER